MEKQENNSNKETQNSLNVTVTLQGFPFLRDLVQKLSYNTSGNQFQQDENSQYGQIMEISSIEAYITGYTHLSDNTDSVRMSYTSSFFFTCTREANGENRLVWTNSLS